MADEFKVQRRRPAAENVLVRVWFVSPCRVSLTVVDSRISFHFIKSRKAGAMLELCTGPKRLEIPYRSILAGAHPSSCPLGHLFVNPQVPAPGLVYDAGLYGQSTRSPELLTCILRSHLFLRALKNSQISPN